MGILLSILKQFLVVALVLIGIYVVYKIAVPYVWEGSGWDLLLDSSLAR